MRAVFSVLSCDLSSAELVDSALCLPAFLISQRTHYFQMLAGRIRWLPEHTNLPGLLSDKHRLRPFLGWGPVLFCAPFKQTALGLRSEGGQQHGVRCRVNGALTQIPVRQANTRQLGGGGVCVEIWGGGKRAVLQEETWDRTTGVFLFTVKVRMPLICTHYFTHWICVLYCIK